MRVLNDLKFQKDHLEDEISQRRSRIHILLNQITSTSEQIDVMKEEAIEIHKAIKILEFNEDMLGNQDRPQKSEPKL